MDRIRTETTINETAAKLLEMFSGSGEDVCVTPRLKADTLEFIDLIRSALFPTVFQNRSRGSRSTSEGLSLLLWEGAETLRGLLKTVLPEGRDHDEIINGFLESLPGILATLRTDVHAAYLGDPAAVSDTEILVAYPSFEAVSIFRLAHRLYELEVPLIPRIMTEFAHRSTGIDIHPGATIGPYFFIDHGTGVVIGETCTIGHHVKLYQGVTLGAKSFELDEDGNPVKGVKRHPDIGNNVVIYAGATVLGGSTVVGDNCVIGGNVWLTHSVPQGESVYNNLG